MKKQLKPVFFLKSSISLKVDHRKLINLLIHELLQTLKEAELEPTQKKSSLELSVSRFLLHNSLDIEGKVKFRISKVINELTSSTFYLGSHSTFPFIEKLSIDKKNITFTLAPHYNAYLFDNSLFAIDQEIQRDITRKNTLFLYELCMSFLSQMKHDISQNETIILDKSITDLKAVLGMEDYKNMRSVDIYRTVFLVSAEDLNNVNPGFQLEVKNNIVDRIIDSLTFKLEIIDAEYINKLIEN